MQRFLIVLLLFSLYCSSNAQDTIKVLYAQDSTSIIQLHNASKVVYTFSDPVLYNNPTELPITLHLGKATITVLTTAQTQTTDQTITSGTFPSRILDTQLKGHILFGKTLLRALDSVGVDSTITLNTQILLKDKVITGPLYLNLKGEAGSYKRYWNEIEYYALLEEQAIVQDSIQKLTADNQRAKALMDASYKYVVVTANQVDANQKELDKKYSQFNTNMESLKKINMRIDEAFEKSKSGQQLTEEEKKQIAYLTTDGSTLKKELKKQPNGAEALKVFEKMSKAMTQNKSAEKQYNKTKQVYDNQAQRLKSFTKRGQKIEQRIQTLKKLLEL